MRKLKGVMERDGYVYRILPMIDEPGYELYIQREDAGLLVHLYGYVCSYNEFEETAKRNIRNIHFVYTAIFEDNDKAIENAFLRKEGL